MAGYEERIWSCLIIIHVAQNPFFQKSGCEVGVSIWKETEVSYFYASFLKKKLILEYSYFTMLYSFLLYRKVNQPYLYMYPLPFGLPSHSGHHSALSRVPCAVQYVLISYLFYT